MSARPYGGEIFTVQPTSDEPWANLPTGNDLEGWTHENRIAYNQANRQSEKYRFYVKVFDFLTDNRIHGDYHEFGCHRVRTFRMALSEARRHNLESMKFFAFDSFAGLPTHDADHNVEIWKAGALTTTEEKFRELVKGHGIYTDRIETIKGFYSDSLTPALRARFLDQEQKIALATVDCDLYESAVPVFDFIEPLLQEGSVIYIDDLFAGYKGSPEKGVAKAFIEFRQRSRFSFIRHLDVGWWGRSYIAYLSDNRSAVDL